MASGATSSGPTSRGGNGEGTTRRSLPRVRLLTEAADLADALVDRLRGGQPDTIALMHLLIGASSPEMAARALGTARASCPGLADAVGRVAALLAVRPEAWATVHAVVDQVDHAPMLGSPDATLDHWRTSFDRLAIAAPEAGVALYALGDPDLLAAATAEVVDALRASDLLGRDRDALDLGCGMGRFSEALAPHMRSVLGLDLSPGMVEEARRRSRHDTVRYAVGNGRDLDGVPDASMHLVLAADVFPYLVEAGLAEHHVAEIGRVLRPGGAAAILNHSYRGDAARDRADLATAASRHDLVLEGAGERPFRLWDAAVFVLRRRA